VLAAPGEIEAKVAEMCRRLLGHAPLTMRAAKEAVRRVTMENLPKGGRFGTPLLWQRGFQGSVDAFLAKPPPRMARELGPVYIVPIGAIGVINHATKIAEGDPNVLPNDYCFAVSPPGCYALMIPASARQWNPDSRRRRRRLHQSSTPRDPVSRVRLVVVPETFPAPPNAQRPQTR